MRADEAKAEAGATQAGVPAPDIPLQPTFDGDDTTHRYRYMEPGPDAALCRSASAIVLVLQWSCFAVMFCRTLHFAYLHHLSQHTLFLFWSRSLCYQ